MDCKELLAIAEHRLLKVTERPGIIMSQGEGMYLKDVQGRSYLDFIGGWAVNCLGHSPLAIAEALNKQARTLINASPAFYNTPMLEYADLLVSQSCLDKVFFMSTGAEANEGAIKLARKFGLKQRGGATEIITTEKGFHGRTLSTMAATGKPHWESLFGVRAEGFVKARFNHLDSVAALVSDKTCAVLLEPIQGEGGVNEASLEFMQGLRELCNREGLILILDEIQTGMARTGKLFCYEHYDIEPDIMTLGKGIGGGFPLSAMLVKDALNIFESGDQGGTYTGQPLAMAAGLAVLREILEKDLIGHSEAMGVYLKQTLLRLSDAHEIENVRGKGLLLAFDLKKSSAPGFVELCREDGLLLNAPSDKTVRLMPPLIVTKEDVQKMAGIMEKRLALL